MTIPDFQSIMLPLLKSIGDGQEHSTKETLQTLATHFGLTEEQLNEMLPSRNQTIFYNRVTWAKAHLKMASLVENTKRGHFKISQLGLDTLKTNPSQINLKFLKQFPDYLENSGRVKGEQRTESVEEPDTDETPEEIIDLNYLKIRNTLALELLSKIKSCSPAFFENLVVDLLVRMGYGGGSTGDGTWNPNPPPGGGGGGSSNGGGSPLTPIELIPGGDLTEAQINLMTQLNAIRQPGDHYYFDNQLSAQNSLSFSSVAEFSQFLASAGITGTTISSTIINQNEKIEHGKFNLTFIGGVDVSCKLSKVGNLWQLGNVTSSEYGVTFGWSWSQSDFAYSTNGNEISLTVEGYVNYNVIVEAIGTVYKQKMKFIIKINNQTGAITSLSKG